MRDNLLVIIFMHLDLLETVVLVKLLRAIIRGLNVEVYLVDLRFRMGRCSGKYQLKALRSQLPGTIWLRGWINVVRIEKIS